MAIRRDVDRAFRGDALVLAEVPLQRPSGGIGPSFIRGRGDHDRPGGRPSGFPSAHPVGGRGSGLLRLAHFPLGAQPGRLLADGLEVAPVARHGAVDGFFQLAPIVGTGTKILMRGYGYYNPLYHGYVKSSKPDTAVTKQKGSTSKR
ncbi:hypothetical protein V5F49_09740 [Xanthobacter sp. V3C-3]|uniref:hypothetical protein n=1 Tax=Xanthobacter lutulentifluminis TaxID=3119935 RepID=UPI00372AA1DE